jgi:hypothetical protein
LGAVFASFFLQFWQFKKKPESINSKSFLDAD